MRALLLDLPNGIAATLNRSRLAALLLATALLPAISDAQTWQEYSTRDGSTVTARHEAGYVTDGDKIYVMGGRGNRPVEVFDAGSDTWDTLAPLPMELHHFQPVLLDGHIYVIGAFTCCYPIEDNVSDIYRLNIQQNEWEIAGSVPAARLRGSTGAVVYDDKIYIVGGNTNGHAGGAVAWLDEYNPATGNWRTLPDAPHARDHFSAAVIDGKLIVSAGRVSNRSFGGMVAETDVYDFDNGTWETTSDIPTPRAGATIATSAGNLIVIGGESDTQVPAHDNVEAYQVSTRLWRSLPALRAGRHGGASGVVNNRLHAITGNIFRGGGNEVSSHEVLDVSDADNDGLYDFEDQTDNTTLDSDADGLLDREEDDLGTNPNSNDTDGDSITDFDEVRNHLTDPNNDDTDSDGLTDGQELLTYNSDPLNPDSDQDGISDGQEAELNTDMNNQDEDGDGISNAAEGIVDTDGDLAPNHTDLDSDNDGIPDITENAIADVNTDGLLDQVDGENQTAVLSNAADLLDSDGDGIANMFDLDSDQDGISDREEYGYMTNLDTGFVSLSADENAIVGWHGASNPLAATDTDTDGQPDFLDADSDNDNESDLLETGGADTDADSRVDGYADTNSNGWHDQLEGEVVVRADTDLDGQPDYLDENNLIPKVDTTGGGGLIITANSAADAIMLILLVAVYGFPNWRRSYTTEDK